MNGLIYALQDAYATTPYQDSADFIGGDCFYFAKILKTLLPECIICSGRDHYFVKYHDFFYDAQGLMNATPTSVMIFGEWVLKKQIAMTDDLEEAELYADMTLCTDKNKDMKFSKYNTVLLEAGQNYLNSLIQEESLKR